MKELEFKIAEEDIPVFMIVKLDRKNNKMYSYTDNFELSLGETCYNEVEIKDDDIRAYKGFYPQVMDNKLSIVIGIDKIRFILATNSEGLATGVYDSNEDNLEGVKANCIIPKGAKYHLYEKDGVYASNQIKVLSIEDVLDK